MIKYLTGVIIILNFSFQAFSQIKDYDETALLFSQEKLNGTARFLSMSGAFGALGGNLSAGEINPAGMAIHNNNAAAITFGVNSNKSTDNFYNLFSSNRVNEFRFAQAGGLLVFKTGNKQWSKFTLSINSTKSNDFDRHISLSGNTHISNENFFLDPDPTADLYNNVTAQKMNNFTVGDNTKTSFAVATKFNKNTYFGLSIISNSIDYFQELNITENSKDLNDNTFQGRLHQRLNLYGHGIGFNFGAITMPMKNLRLGLSYQSPSWYTLTEEFNENMNVSLSNANVDQPDNIDSIFDYQLKTPAKTTGSIAYVFDKKGLISLDYSFKDYRKLKLSPTNDFEQNFNYNKSMSDNYQAVSTINIGGEYRLKYLSLRGGYHFENSPYKTKGSNIKGYSLGFGFKTGEYSNLDFAFNQTSYHDINRFLTSTNPILSNDIVNKFTASYSLSF